MFHTLEETCESNKKNLLSVFNMWVIHLTVKDGLCKEKVKINIKKIGFGF